MTLLYNPTNEFHKSVVGAVKENEPFTLRVKSNSLSDCKVLFVCDKDKREFSFEFKDLGDYFEAQISLNKGLYWYSFYSNGKRFGRDKFLNCIENGDNYELLVYDGNYLTPDTVKGSVIYQIFPDRFCSLGTTPENIEGRIYRAWGEMPYYKPNENGKVLNNDFFLGNFKGIISKLSYLKELSVKIIYLNPISLAQSNHRYDTSNYMEIDPLLGDFQDFENLCQEADKLGIKIIIDGVYNHTGDDSVYFNKYGKFSELGAYQSKKSRYYDWYVFHKYPDKYLSWWGIDILPTINKNSVEFEDYICGNGGVIEKYLSVGASGIRLDVVDELPSTFVKKIRKTVKKCNEDAFIIGEVWEDATCKIAYDERKEYFLGEELDSVMNYPLKNAIIEFLQTQDASVLKQVVLEQINNYPTDALNCLMNILDTHDTFRIFNALAVKNPPKTRREMHDYVLTPEELYRGEKLKKLAVVLQFLLYGSPCIYYGDEVGMRGFSDPFNRQCFPWDNVDGNLLDFYKLISKIKTENLAFKVGKVNIIYAENEVFAFERTIENDSFVVAVNCGEYAKSLELNEKYKDIIEGEENLKFTLSPSDYKILKRI